MNHTTQSSTENQQPRQEETAQAMQPTDGDSGDLVARIEQLQLLNETLKKENEALNRSVAARFREIAVLTNMLESGTSQRRPANALLSQTRGWLKKVSVADLPGRAREAVVEFLKLRKHVRLVNSSGLLDPKWYLENNPDLAASRKASKHPAWHYVKFGGFEGRDPSMSFASTWYLAQNPDVASEGTNPLVHYILNGKHEGRLPIPPDGHFL